MTTGQPPHLSAAVEGLVDEAVLRCLSVEAGAVLGLIYGRSGKAHLRQRIGGYNQAAQFSPWIVLVDLDDEVDCAPPLRAAWLPSPAPMMCFRIAVREVEAWLFGDRTRLARFLGVAAVRLPLTPETVVDPKRTMVDLARQSSRRDIREDMVPRPGSGRAVGPAYSARLVEYATSHWRPEVAAENCDSLRRCRQRLGQLIQGR